MLHLEDSESSTLSGEAFLVKDSVAYFAWRSNPVCKSRASKMEFCV